MLFLSVHLAPSFLSLSFAHTLTRFSLPRDQEIPCKRFRPYILAILQHSMKSRSTSGAGNKTCNLPEFVNGSSSMITFSFKYIERIRKYHSYSIIRTLFAYISTCNNIDVFFGTAIWNWHWIRFINEIENT